MKNCCYYRMISRTCIYGDFTKMRAYFFTNMYLSSIQQGIQPLHVVGDMFVKYNEMNRLAASYQGSEPTTMQWDILMRWAREHKTVICLNAGYSQEIHDLVKILESPDNPFPWAYFNEGNDALDGALTSVGIILPEEVYGLAAGLRDKEKGPMIGPCIDGQIMVYPYVARGKYGDCVAPVTPWMLEFAEKMNTYGMAK